MKTKYFWLTLMIFSCVLSTVAIGQQGKNPQQGEKIKFRGKYGISLPYKMVEEISLPSNAHKVKLSKRTKESAGNLKIFGEETNNDGRTIPGESLFFYDDNGNLKNTKKLEKKKLKLNTNKVDEKESIRTRIDKYSKYGNHVLLRTHEKQTTKEENGKYKFELFDNQGNLKWVEEITRIYDASMPDYYFSDYDGSGIRVDWDGIGNITFFDPQGNRFKELDYYKERQSGCVQNVDFSNDGKYLAVGMLEYPEYDSSIDMRTFINRNSIGGRLTLFTKRGEEVWTRKGDQRSWKSINFSPDNKIISACNHSNGIYLMYFFDATGNVLKKFEDINANEIVFSEDNKFAVLRSNGSQDLILIDLNTFEILIKIEGYMFFSADVSSEKKLVATIAGNRLVVLHFNGTPVLNQPLGFDFNPGGRRPQNIGVQLSEDGNEILVMFENTLQKYLLEQ